jgi:anti-sigma factor RsiW
MSCTANREILSAYVDGELPAPQALGLSEHLTSCTDCASEYESILKTVQTLRESLVRYRAPDVLRARVRAALREERRPQVSLVPTATRLPWRAIAAALMIAVSSSALTMIATQRRSSAAALTEEVLTNHIRSLMPEHLTDVRSNDQHNVKPWFNGRLDYSPAVPRLEERGFPLLGGRLDYVHKRPVAVVIYGRRQHIINVYSWPSEAPGDAAAGHESRQGYNVLHWRRSGVEYWVVSDLNAAELEQFASLLRAA